MPVQLVRKTLVTLILLAALLQTGFAQLCSGSLGDPVAWITFGAGSSAPPPLPAYSTTYKYVNSSCPNDGEYTLKDLSFGCFNSTWHTLAGDHTPNDGIGKYMLVNASNDPGDFFVDTVTGLCGNTSYELSAWIVNMLKPDACNANGIDPNLTFRVETTTGTVLVKYDSGDIPETEGPQWRQFGTFFRTPAGATTVVIRITNNSRGGCGNDIALDDITFRPCGPTINAMLATNGQNNINVCVGSEIPYLLSSTVSGGFTNPALQWQISLDNGFAWADIPGATGPTYLRQPTGEGNYQYRLVIAEGANIGLVNCRIASKPVIVNVNPPPFVQATNYVFSCYGSTVVLFAAGGSKYEWTGPNGFRTNEQQPKISNVQFTDAGLYKVKVTTAAGCFNFDSTDLQVYPAATAVTNPDVSICEGESVQLTASGGTKYKWEPGASLSSDVVPNPIARPKDSTRYVVIVVNEYNCFDTASVAVNVWRRPSANAGPDKKMLIGRPIQLTGTAGGTAVTFNWTPLQYISQPNSIRPAVNPPADQRYRLEVNSTVGCGSASDEVLVKVFEKIVVPNTFTPNGDGYNDRWEIELLDIFTEAVIEVYNTSGQRVYRSIGYNKAWDGTQNGKPLPTGTYYYVINLKVNADPLVGYVTIWR
ncbi:MAG: gliding motility-associated C-terminal domain-containing protein [Chitinophagaceae bacterium]|nr:gliding motility-associated C-terminal domain-containing protein [Chitinophagaceae bacterium]